MELEQSQKSLNGEINSLNKMAQADGVHAGLLSHYTKIARMKPEKAALWLALDDFYRQALASRLPNPAVEAAEAAEAAEADVAVPFDRKKAAA